MNTARFSELVELFIDQQLSPEQAAELRALVELEPEFAERFAHEVRQHMVFSAPLRSESLNHLPERVRALIALDRPSSRASLVAAVAHRRRRPRKAFQLPSRHWFAFAASLLLVVGLLTWRWSQTRGESLIDDHLAVLQNSTNTTLIRTGASSEAINGLKVMPGDRLIAKAPGSVLTYSDGTAVTLDAGTVITIASINGGKKLTLSAGSLDAHVAPQPSGQPMRVWAPDGLVDVVGTVFQLTSEPLGTRLSVDDGLVRFTDRQGSPAIPVAAGQQARASQFRAAHLITAPVARGRTRLLDACDDLRLWHVSTDQPATIGKLSITSERVFEGRGAVRMSAKFSGFATEYAAMHHDFTAAPNDRAMTFRLRVEQAEIGCSMSVHGNDGKGNLWRLANWPISPSETWQEIVLPLLSTELPVHGITVSPGVQWNPQNLKWISVIVHGGSSQVCVDAFSVESN